MHYANLWWSLPEKGAYMALGRHSQLIIVHSETGIVATMTGILRDDEFYPIPRLVDDISKAVKSDTPLPADPVAQGLLATAIRGAATEKPAAVGGTPDLAKEISGKTYQFAENNALHVKSFHVEFSRPDSSWEITTDTGKDQRSTDRFSGLIGLDGVFRKSPPAFYGINAAKGRWISEHTFEIDRRILGHSETQIWTLTFDGDKVTVNFENTDGFKTQLHGEMSE